jgi:hypothetical protein
MSRRTFYVLLASLLGMIASPIAGTIILRLKEQGHFVSLSTTALDIAVMGAGYGFFVFSMVIMLCMVMGKAPHADPGHPEG